MKIHFKGFKFLSPLLQLVLFQWIFCAFCSRQSMILQNNFFFVRKGPEKLPSSNFPAIGKNTFS